MRCFRASQAVYQQVRASLDNAWGLPSAETRTETCLPPTPETDSLGRALVAVPDEFCEFPASFAALAQLLAAGVADEISLTEYLSELRASGEE